MKIATSLGIKGAWDMKKSDVIDAIVKANENVAKDKDYYIEHIQISTLIAFRVSGKKANLERSLRDQQRIDVLWLKQNMVLSLLFHLKILSGLKPGSVGPKVFTRCLKVKDV